jgi:putative hydrolase of the HAD superfamily
MIKAAFFDLDETLLDRTSSLKAFLADQYARYRDCLGTTTLETWRDRFLALDDRGNRSKVLVYPRLLAEFGGNPNEAGALIEDYRDRCSLHARPFAGMSRMLIALRELGMKLAIITNGEVEFQSRHIAVLGLKDLVDEILISEAEGLRKPDAAIFIRAAQRFSVRPADCLFVGDNPVSDILGAHAVGMRTLWFRSGFPWPHDHAQPCPAIDSLSQVFDMIADGGV